MNAGLAVAGDCAFVGSRDGPGVAIVDVADPARPQPAGELSAHAATSTREVRAVPTQHLLVVMDEGAFNGFDIYRWDIDCRHPVPLTAFDMGTRRPHEFYLWEDPAAPGRVLLFVAMFGAPGNALDVVDLSDPARPVAAGGWAYAASPLHSVDVTADGRTAYLSLWTGGLLVADVSDFTAGRPAPRMRLVTPAPVARPAPPGNVHSAVPVPGRALLVVTDERFPPPYGPGCPYGSAAVYDVAQPAAPARLASLGVHENAPGACGEDPLAAWTSHNVTTTPNLALVSWYAAGLQVFDIADAAHPVVVAQVRPGAVTPSRRDPQLGPSPSLTWSYPVLSRGLVYVADINQGLLVYRYLGPHDDEVASAALVEGNSNATPAAATSPAATTSPSGEPLAPPAVAEQGYGLSGAAIPLVAAAAVVLVVLLAGLSVAARR
ncbi:MAG: hypothetical protein QOE92_2100, partial [Chloroflexota bacterium]|nr:hypothetical protein [Chloroflexota bacterium]